MTRRIVTSPFAEDGPPSTPAGPPPQVPVLAHHVVLASAVGTSLLHVATAVLVTARRGELADWLMGSTSPTTAALSAANFFLGLAGLCTFVAFFATGVWLTRLRPVAQWVAPARPPRRSPAWAFLGWIVPIVSLWFPYQVVADTSRALGSRVTNFWPWWIAWLVLTWMPLVGMGGSELATVDELDSWILESQATAVLSVIACVLWWRIVRSATTAAETATTGG